MTSEIVLEDLLGYGDYVVTARADQGSFAALDKNVVFGLFTYQFGEAPPSEGKNRHREIDLLETISKEAQGYDGNAQFTLQPAFDLEPPNLLHRYKIPDTEYVTAWMSRYDARKKRDVCLRLYAGNYSYNDLMSNPTLKPITDANWQPVAGNTEPTKIEPYVPLHTAQSCERFHINLYLIEGKPPARQQSITLTRFEYYETS